MTKEDQKELLIKDICPRLPYGVKAYVRHYSKSDRKWYEGIYTIKSAFPSLNEVHVQAESGSVNVLVGYADYEIKPYLFPLSSMTEEQKTYISNRWGINEDFNFEINPDWGKYFVDLGDARDFIDWLNENHFDYRGLIYEGLAIDCTTLNIY